MSVTRVAGILKTLPNKTSAGLDDSVLKHLPGNIILDYTILFNNYINNKFFPDPRKEAKIFFILRKGEPSNQPSSYRSISLIPAISKVFKVIINSSLKHHKRKEKVLSNEQFGFSSVSRPLTPFTTV